MTDSETTIAEIRQRLQQFVTTRQWDQYHTPKNLAMSIAIEAAELMEHFQWTTPEGSQRVGRDEEVRSQIAEELADIVIYCLHFANQMSVDVSEAVDRKLTRNETRFPPGFVPSSADERP